MAGIGSGGGKAVFGRGTTTGVVVRVGVSKGATAAAAAVLAMRYAPRISGMYDGPGRRRVGGGGGAEEGERTTGAVAARTVPHCLLSWVQIVRCDHLIFDQ